MTDSESTNLSKRVIVTEDGVVRYYWWEWVPALFWAILGLGLIPILVFFLLPPLYLLLYFLLPGLGVLYFAIGKAFNYTEFRVESGNLFVHHKPLPWRGNISIPTMEIGNIDVKKIDTIHYDSNDFGSTVTYSVKYQVAAIRQDRQLPLISVRSLDIADAIAQEVGTALGKSRRINTKNRISALRESLSNDETKLIQKTVLDPSTPYFLLLVFLTGVFFTYAGVNNIREWRASQSWPSVTGRVVEPQIVEVRDESDGNVSFSYTLKITYQYSVNDKIYTSDRISFVGRPSYISENLAQQALRNMSPDGRVNVYYNPADPNRAVLDHQTFYNSYNTELVIGITFLVMSTIGALILIWYRKRFANKIRKKTSQG